MTCPSRLLTTVDLLRGIQLFELLRGCCIMASRLLPSMKPMLSHMQHGWCECESFYCWTVYVTGQQYSTAPIIIIATFSSVCPVFAEPSDYADGILTCMTIRTTQHRTVEQNSSIAIELFRSISKLPLHDMACATAQQHACRCSAWLGCMNACCASDCLRLCMHGARGVPAEGGTCSRVAGPAHQQAAPACRIVCMHTFLLYPRTRPSRLVCNGY